MNAAPIMPAKAEIPVAQTTEGHRGNAPRTPGQEDSRSFMSTLRKVNDEVPAQESKESHAVAGDDASGPNEIVSNPADEESLAPETILAETDQLLLKAAAANPVEENLNIETGTANEKPISELADNAQPAAGDDLTAAAADDYLPVDTMGLVAAGDRQLPAGEASATLSKQKTAVTTAAEIPPEPKQTEPVHDHSATDSHEMQNRPKLVRPVMSERIVSSDAAPAAGDDLPEAVEARIREQMVAPNATKANTTRPADWNGIQATLATPSETQVLSNAFGRPNGKNGSMTDPNRPNPKVVVEAATAGQAQPTEGQTQPTEGQTEAKAPLDSIQVEKPMESNRFVRPTPSDTPGRLDWLTPVDRADQAPLNKFSPSMTIAKEDVSLSTESFRENNVAQIVERVAVSVRGGQSEARIALKPDHLGSLRVQIITENNTVSIKIMTEFSMARDLLESHLPQLKMELQQQGLEVEKFDVLLSEDQQNLRRHGRQQQHASAARPNSGSRDENADEQTDEDTQVHVDAHRPQSVGVDFFA